MSLATRCTSCGTVFRVVQDQLKVSEGWVRCGRCDTVFNALEGLLDLERESPTDWEPPALEPLPASPAPPAGESDLHTDGPADPVADEHPLGSEEATPSSLEERYADPLDAHLFGPRKRAETGPKPAGQVGARDRLEFSDARFDSDLFAENPSVPDDETQFMPATDAGGLPLESAHQPGFLRRAELRARWRGKPARIALAVACGLAGLFLVAQVIQQSRNVLAAHWPALRPVLAAWCSVASCKVEPLRRLEDVFVENSGLAPSPGGDAFVLSVNLRNRSGLALLLPSIDLALTDANGRLLARRVLDANDFRAAPVLPAQGEAALQATFSTGAAVVGYGVEIFYP